MISAALFSIDEPPALPRRLPTWRLDDDTTRDGAIVRTPSRSADVVTVKSRYDFPLIVIARPRSERPESLALSMRYRRKNQGQLVGVRGSGTIPFSSSFGIKGIIPVGILRQVEAFEQLWLNHANATVGHQSVRVSQTITKRRGVFNRRLVVPLAVCEFWFECRVSPQSPNGRSEWLESTPRASVRF